jgi:hypothetical protein
MTFIFLGESPFFFGSSPTTSRRRRSGGPDSGFRNSGHALRRNRAGAETSQTDTHGTEKGFAILIFLTVLFSVKMSKKLSFTRFNEH